MNEWLAGEPLMVIMNVMKKILMFAVCVVFHAQAMESVPAEYVVQTRTFIREHQVDIDHCKSLFVAEVEKKYRDARACIVIEREQRLVEDVFEWSHCVPVSFTCSSWSFFKTLSPDDLLGSIEALGRLRTIFGLAVLAPEAKFMFGDTYIIRFIGPDHLLKPMAERIKNFSAALLSQLSPEGEQ